jgi:hypothetical protein
MNIHKTEDLNLTPPPLRGTSGRSPSQRWEILFKLFLDDLRRSRDGGFFDHVFDSSCLRTVNLDMGRELDRRRDGCDTGICWGGTAQDR